MPRSRPTLILLLRTTPSLSVGRYQDAVPDLQEVIRVHVVDTCDGLALTQKAHFRLARCYCELGRYGDAMQEMERYRVLIGGQPKLAETSLTPESLVVSSAASRRRSTARLRRPHISPMATMRGVQFTTPRMVSRKDTSSATKYGSSISRRLSSGTIWCPLRYAHWIRRKCRRGSSSPTSSRNTITR